MPTNEERREVARKLRESRESALDYRIQLEEVGINLFCCDQADYYLIHKAVAGCLPAEHMHPCDYAELHDRLADLIDPEPERTCRLIKRTEHLEDDAFGEVLEIIYECSVCKTVNRKDAKYCDECGAKVVDDAN